MRAWGGRLLPGCGASGVGRSPTPDHSSVRACDRGPLPTGCGCGGCGHGNPSRTLQRALLRAGLARCGGGMGVPGEGPLAWVWGVRGGALSHPRPLVHSGVRPWPTTHWLWMRGVRAWGPVTNPTARRLVSLICALWGRHQSAWGERLLPGCGASGDGRLPTPDLSSVRACGRGPLCTGCGCAGCGRGDPSPTPQRALLRAGFARCGGCMRVPRGAPFASVWGVRGRALSHPRPLVRSGVRPGPTTHWLWVRGLRAWGPVTNPTARALLCCGGGMRVPAGGASCLGVGGPKTGALPPPSSRSFGRAAGAHYPLAVGAGGAGVGTRYQPHSARSCALWGRHEGARGGRLLPGCRGSGDGRSPTPDLRSVWACGRGPLPTGCGCGGCGRGDPSPTPQRALLRAVGAALGSQGGAPLAWVWGVQRRALSHPRALVLSGVRPGPTTHWLWVREPRAWGPVTNPTARALARCGGGMRVPGGGASCLGVGGPETGALPPPTSGPFGRAAGAHYPLAVGAGGAGVGTRHQPHNVRSCELALHAVGAA